MSDFRPQSSLRTLIGALLLPLALLGSMSCSESMVDPEPSVTSGLAPGEVEAYIFDDGHVSQEIIDSNTKVADINCKFCPCNGREYKVCWYPPRPSVDCTMACREYIRWRVQPAGESVPESSPDRRR